MNLNKLILIACTLVGSSALAAPAPIVSSTLEAEPSDNKGFGIGLVSSIAQRPFVGVDDQNTSLLYLSYRYKDFYIEGLDLGYTVVKNNKYKVDVLATPRFYEVEPAFADNGELDGIDKTNPTYLAGVSLQTNLSSITYTAQLLHDIVESDGSEAVVQASKSFAVSDGFTVSPSAGITYQDKKLVDHFYGVQANEVRAGRALYVGQGSVNYNLTLHSKWEVTKQIELLGQFRYEFLGDGITDSPIVDEDKVYSLSLGLLYRF